jgi:ketosteroid isomerase-like protein
MRARGLATFIIILLGLGIPGLADRMTAQKNPGSEEEAVKAILTAMWKAVEEGDLDKYARFVHPQYSAFGENDVYLAEGRDLELRMMEGYLKRATNVRTEMHQPKVIIRGDVAWILYYWTDEGLSEGKRFTSRGKSTRIFVKENGKWLCIHGHFTAAPK